MRSTVVETFLKKQDLIELDYNRDIFLNLVWIKQSALSKNKEGKLVYLGKVPSIIHGNGPGKMTFYVCFIKDLVEKYGLSQKVHDEIKEELQFPWGWK